MSGIEEGETKILISVIKKVGEVKVLIHLLFDHLRLNLN